jgi:hypothetical protein
MRVRQRDAKPFVAEPWWTEFKGGRMVVTVNGPKLMAFWDVFAQGRVAAD